MAFGPSTLREVVRVAQVQSIAGLDIALVALERHDTGARLQYMCHASDQRTRAEMCMLDVIAVDDAGPALPGGLRADVPDRATGSTGRWSSRRRSRPTSAG